MKYNKKNLVVGIVLILLIILILSLNINKSDNIILEDNKENSYWTITQYGDNQR